MSEPGTRETPGPALPASGDDLSQVATVFIMIVATIATTIIIVLMVCYRRRFHRLKNEFAHVHYRANPTHSQVAANEENLYSYPGELIGRARHYGGGGGGTVMLAPQFVGPVRQSLSPNSKGN